MHASTNAVSSHAASVSAVSVKARPNYLILSAHDYRTPRRASIHFITDELAKRGDTRFFSLRYSWLSRFKKD
ncbi:MAG TPA: GumK N-terminal domain-containing glycosyltransferase, partial [Xylella taiwanensis]